MALDKICDKCGAKSASEVRVDITMMDVVTKDMPTGINFVTDACELHRVEECERLFRDALKQLLRDIPRHKELIELNETDRHFYKKINAASNEKEEFKEAHILRAQGVEKWDNPKSEQEYRRLQVVVDGLQKEQEALTERRKFVLDDKNY